ncbi:MAG: response regulator [Desulfobacterales bacterium]
MNKISREQQPIKLKGNITMKVSVLVVDDEKEFADVLAERLQIKGYQAEACYSGPEALEKIRDGEIDIVLLDLVMPVMDGLAVLNEIKKINPVVEVVMLSGKATPENAIEELKQGAFEHLDKPCDDDQLVTSIDRAHRRKLAHEERIRLALERVRRASKKAEGKNRS